MNDIDHGRALLGLTAQIVSAHVQRNTLPAEELPALIRAVHGALATAGTAPPAPEAERPAPPPPPKRTIFPDHIVCLEDGRKLKTLKRHLRSTYDMSPEEYREKWGLPADYPMVAPSYAARRSSLAKSLGLGRKSTRKAATDIAEAAPIADIQEDDAEPPRAARTPIRIEDAPPPRETRQPEPTAESVFARFTPGETEEEAAAESAPASESGPRKAQRKPFSKQFARSMRTT